MLIRSAVPADTGEIFTLQRAAFVDEAWVYGTANVPSLTETLADTEARLAWSFTLVGTEAQRLVGAVSLRSYRPGGPDVERLMVAPDRRRAGLATKLMTTAEAHVKASGESIIQLIVGELATFNQKLYQRLGYTVAARFPLESHPHVMLLSMTKELPGA